jgi:restriction system protein
LVLGGSCLGKVCSVIDVKGVIIGFEDDIKIKRALLVTTNIEFYKYRVDFKLYK